MLEERRIIIVRPRCVQSKRKQSPSLMSLHSGRSLGKRISACFIRLQWVQESFQYTFTYCEAKCYRLYAKRDLIVFVIEIEYHLFLSLPGYMCWFREHCEIGYRNKRRNIYNSINNLSLLRLIVTKRSHVFRVKVIGMLTTVWKRLLTLLLIVDPTIRQTVIKGMLYYNIVSMFRVCFPAC